MYSGKSVKMIMLNHRSLLICGLLFIFLGQSAQGQEKFSPNIADFFQHQQWGAKGFCTGAATIECTVDTDCPAANRPCTPFKFCAGDGKTICRVDGDCAGAVPPVAGPCNATDPGAVHSWELNGGVCFFTAVVNQFFFFKKKDNVKFGKLLDDKITVEATWLAQQNAEILKLEVDYLANGNDLNKVLDNRLMVAAADRVGKALVRMELKQDGTCTDPLKKCTVDQDCIDASTTGPCKPEVRYKSTAPGGNLLKITDNSLYRVAQTIMNDRNTVNLRLAQPNPKPAPLPAERLRWWWDDVIKDGFHVVTMAGHNDFFHKLWFADPDSNPDPGSDDGNKNANAGWICDTDHPRKSAPSANPIKKRRFQSPGGPDPMIPVSGESPGTITVAKRLFPATLTDLRTSFDVFPTPTPFDRYDGVRIMQLETVEVVKAAPKPPAGPESSGPGEPKRFRVSPGQAGALDIDEFWLFPANGTLLGPFDFFDGNNAPLPGWQVQLIGAIDDWDNPRPWGGVYVFATTAPALMGQDILEMTYEGAPLDAWDIVVNNSVNGFEPRVQTSTGSSDLPAYQKGLECEEDSEVAVPTVSGWGLAALTVILLIGGKVYFGRRIRPAR